MQTEPLLNAEQIKEKLGLSSVNAVRIMCSRREIPFIRLGRRRIRFSPEQIELWLEKNRIEIS